MVSKVLIKRTSTPDSPPTALDPGELAVEMADPTRLWVGVPASLGVPNNMKLLAPSSSGGGVTVAETPPATPAPGDLWWETDTGHLFIYYDDGTSQQWVSTSLQGPAGVDGADGVDGVLADAPSDGNEYVRVNGVWRLSRQTIDASGLTMAEFIVPAGARMLRAIGEVRTGVTAGTQILCHVSLDGTTYLAGAMDYFYVGAIHYSTAGYNNLVGTNASGLFMAFSHAIDTMGALFDFKMQITKPAGASVFWDGVVHATTYASTASGYGSSHHRVMLQYLNTGAFLDIKKFRFSLAVGTTIFAPGSFITCEWIY